MSRSMFFVQKKNRFLNTLMKNQNYREILDQIQEEKKVNFFAKNYQTFLQTHDQLQSLKLPQLKQIPKSRQFHLKLSEPQTSTQDTSQATVIELIDSFSTHVLQKNTEEVLRLYKLIKEMKEHTKYQPYFYKFSVNKIFRQAYISFVQNCHDVKILCGMGEYVQAMKVFLQDREKSMLQKIRTDLRVDDGVIMLKNTLRYILQQIQTHREQFIVTFQQYLTPEPQLSLYFSLWLTHLTTQFYHSIQPFVYEHEEISEILKKLSELLQTSKQLESRGLSLHQQLKTLIANDLPLHLQKIMEVVMESFGEVLKYSSEMYEFVEVKELGRIPEMMEGLIGVGKKDYGKKCCSKKGILLVNSFLVILMPLCEQNWSFLHENITSSIIDKVKSLLEQQKVKLPLWDYYHLFMFFYNLYQGKVRHRILFPKEFPTIPKQKITKIKKLSEECRLVFESELTSLFWQDVLSQIPDMLWEFKPYAEMQQKSALKPTTFSIGLIFMLQDFFKQIQFRISKQHYEYLGIHFYQYIIYTLQYILFWTYHDRGNNQKVFTLYKKDDKLLQKAVELFPIDSLPCVKAKNILKLSYFTKFGLERFVVDYYFFTDAYRLMLNRLEKIKAEDFLYKVSKILAKEQKNEAFETGRAKYSELLKQFLNVYEKNPEVIKKYLNEKRGGQSQGKSQKLQQSKEKARDQ